MNPLRLFKDWIIDQEFIRKKQFLRELEIFSDLKSSDLGELVYALHSRHYQAEEIVFKQGDIGRALFILEKGRVELTRTGPDGKPILLYTLAPGDFFGEMALLESLPRTATATAVENSHIYLLYRSKLDSLLDTNPRIGVSIMSHLAHLLSTRLRKSIGSHVKTNSHE